MSKTFKQFEEHCRQIQQATNLPKNESPRAKQARIKKAKADYNYFFTYYFPMYATSKCAWFHTQVAEDLKADATYKGVLEWFRGSAKSTHATIGYPLWLMINGELKNFLLVGQTQRKAIKLLSALQAQLLNNQRLIHDFGEQYSYGNWSQGEFITKSECAFSAIGMGQSPRGTRNNAFRPDYIVCDDLDNQRLCRNPKRVKEACEWILEDLMGCFDIGFERFLLVNNRISKNSILAKLTDEMVTQKQVWHHVKVNAVDEQGKPTWKEKYTKAYWTKKRSETPHKSFEKEYMNNPIEEGTLFKADWIQWKHPLPLSQYERIVAYCDPSFKNTKTSDYKAIKVWGKAGKELHLLDAFVRQCSINAMVSWMYDHFEALPENVVCDYYIEANFMQDLLLDEFVSEGEQRGYQLPIRGDKRKKPEKFSRIEALSPLYERGLIFYNQEIKQSQDMQRAVEQLLAIEPGSRHPDDSPDADEGAIHILQKTARVQNYQARIGRRTKPTF